MELYYSFSMIIVIATLFAYVNKLFLKLLSTIGIMVIAMIVSIVLVFFVSCISGEPMNNLARLFQSLDFTDEKHTELLLFAGAIHINLNDQKEPKAPVVVFSMLSIIISTFTVGFALYYLLHLFLPMLDLHLEIP